MVNFLIFITILLAILFFGYWFVINTKWLDTLKRRFFIKKLMRTLRKKVKKILGAVPKQIDDTHIKLGNKIFTLEEYEKYYRDCFERAGYVETEYGWEKQE